MSDPKRFFSTDDLSALDAKVAAQRLAFGPVAFQACRVLRQTGILEIVRQAGDSGLTLAEVVAKGSVPRYGVKVLLEAGLGIGLFRHDQDRFILTRLGYFMLRDPMTRINMDVVHDICYRGFYHLDEALATGRPAGLPTLGNWETFYQGLSALPEPARASWLAFDHYYSDQAFPAALPLVFADRPQRLLDVGGNTGRWAMQCVGYDPTVRVTIADLPPQLELARAALPPGDGSERVTFHPVDLLDERQELPGGYEVVWMSQFLDCFSEAQIVSILKRAARALGDNGTLHILELFWDRQPNETAAFCLQQTSLYFACIANGNSQMYHSEDLLRCLREAGLQVIEQRDQVGQFHTWLKCRRA